MAADVFVSHAHSEWDRVRPWVQRLQAAGVSLWPRNRIEDVSLWSEEAVEAIKECRVLLLILSRTSVASAHVVREVKLARKGRKPILPLLLEPVHLPLSLRFALAGTHYIPLFEGDPEVRLSMVLRSLLQHGLQLPPLRAGFPGDEAPVFRGARDPLHAMGKPLPADRPDRSIETDASPLPPITDLVHFSVTAPSVLRPNHAYVIDVWAHLAEHREEILKRAKEAQGTPDVRLQSKSGVRIARGTLLTAHLTLPGAIIEHTDDVLLWEGEISNAQFPIYVPEYVNLGPHPGTATLHAAGMQIAKLHFTLEIGPQEAPVSFLAARAQRYRTAFASYASEDREAVIARVQGMLKVLPDLDLFLDVLSLRSGENWEQRLMSEITSRDVFYLFWSLAASRSPWVEKEWRTALNLRGIDYIDPVPLAPPHKVPPPPELARLHFNDWLLAYITS
jgi:TIR domain-containing protein